MKTAMTLLLRGLALTSFLISGAAPLAVNYDDNEAAISTREKREAQTSFPGSQSFSSASRQFSDFTTSSRIGPRFSSDIFEARISEGSERGGSIGEVTASSPNGENVEYFLQTNETSSFLTIDRNSGKLILREDPRDVKEGVNLFTVVASSSTGGNATARVKVRVSYSNRHRPVFTNCNQTASVFEQDTSGPFLFRIQATDEDLGINGQEGLKYSIIQVPGSAVTSFRIEENTGEIFANRAFDRDEPENERKLTIPIRVVDGGTPPLDNVCVLPVEVKDVNDNEPLFDRSEYEVSVPNDREVGSEVLLISATDIDDAENAQITFSLEPDEYSPEDVEYFRIDSGQIHLNKPLNSVREGTKLRFMARAQDSGRPPKSATVKVTVSVVEPALKAPTWVGPDRVRVPETFIQYEIPIANFSVTSNSDPAGRLYTEILRGQSENTNSKPNFGIRMENNVVYVYLVSGSPLDYERITNYDLTLTALDVTNKLRAEKNLHVEVEPMNDNAPIFGLMKELVVLENEPEGTLVGTVVAEDKDAWDDHNRVSYSWANPDEAGTEIFSINPRSGEVTTRKKLDREEQDFYILNIMASDNYPSAIKLDGSPNNSTIQLLVKVKDVNDNPPIFEKDVYDAEVLETMVNRSLVLKVRAVDADESSELIYSITGGNEEGRFSINERNGEIRIANDLDYEKTQRYSLTISVSDAKFFATTTAKIAVKNVADEPPKFESSEYRVTIAENTTFLPYELLRVKAHDPEGGGSVGYFLQAEDEDTYRVESDGTLFLRKALDRDAPDGKETWDVRVWAHTGDRKDELVSYTTVFIALTDINDNAPFLVQINPPPLVWEDSCEGCPVVGGCKHVAELRAKDNDGPDNGAPFSFALDVNADPDITRLFRIEEQNGKWILYNQTMFDREKQKQYRVPIIVTDSPKNGFPLSATSYLKVVIGDCNDNEMFDGYSEIFVMNYKNQLPQTKIGRVFVEDADDWDLNDKTFQWESLPSAYFDLDSSTGDVLLVPGYGDKTQHLLHFKVYDRKWDKTVSATVNVTIQIIPAEAASDRKAGSIRFMNIDQGMFIDSTKDGWSRMEELKRFIGDAVGYPPANVDVLSIRTVDDDVFHPKTDVRFAVHGSPYMASSKLNWEMTARQIELKQALKLPNEVDIELIGISECLEEKTCESSCVTVVQTTTRGYLVGSNRTSLLAVDTWTEPHCACEPPPEITFINGQPCARAPCRNGGNCVISSLDPRGYVCECPERFNGPDCELMELGFSGDGYALMNALPACNDTEISMAILTDIKDDAILMYTGPVSPRASVVRKDVFSLELREGRPVLIINYGDRTGYLESRDSASRINDGNWHLLSVRFGPGRALISVDGRDVLEGLIPETREHKMLNVNGPLQLGGVVHDMLALLGTFGWEPGFHPTTGDSSFKGCLANLTINGRIIDFADAFLKSPEVAGECRSGPGVAKVATWKAKPEFYVAITGCLAGLLLLLLVLVFIKRRHYDASWEDGADEHSRDTLGTYSEEGGGEGDTVTYDPHLLKVSLLDDEAKLRRRAKGGNEQQAVDNAEIASFLDNNKRKADDGDDDDQDDVRHYAYEGQGSSVGSLSSLSSDGQEEPVDEDFLCRLGPEFRKLADMYKGSESDSDEPVFTEEDVYGTAGVRQRRMGPIGGSGGGGGGSAVTGPVPPESWC